MEKVVPLLEQVERIVSISLSSDSCINHLPSISVENGPFPIFLAESFKESLSNSVDELTIDFCSNLKVVITEDDLLIIGGEDSCSILFSGDFEVKGRFSILKRD